MGDISLATGFVGGIGLFLLGLWLATDGLKIAAGGVLRANLRDWTRDRWRSFETGFAIAILLPSSGTLTHAAVGVVNSGRVRLVNALWVVVGCSFGSVITAWLVVAIGFSPYLVPLTLTAIGIGVFLMWTSAHSTRGSWGQVLVGTGLVFFGLRILTNGFGALEASQQSLLPLGASYPELQVGIIGIALAALLSSSSAAVALLLVAASTGVLDLSTAAAGVIGANLGASTAAAWAILRGTPAAQRVAMGHVLFHVVTSAIGLLLLAWMPVLGEISSPIFALALFHTIFSALGACVLWILTQFVVTSLEGYFRDKDADRSNNLDDNVLSIPDLALEGLVVEVGEAASIAHQLTRVALGQESMNEARRRQELATMSRLAVAIEEYLAKLSRTRLPARVADHLVEISRASETYCNLSAKAAAFCDAGAVSGPEALGADLRRMRLLALQLVAISDPFHRNFSMANSRAELERLRVSAETFDQTVIRAVASGGVDTENARRIAECGRAIRELGEAVVEGAQHLETVRIEDPERQRLEVVDAELALAA